MSGAEAPAASSFLDFDRWSEEYLAASSDEARLALEREGDSLAQTRRRDLAQLIESDPERAIRLAVPLSVRHRLPPRISRHLEDRVSARAKYEVIGVLGIPDDPMPRLTIERRVTVKDKTYRAFVYGRRLQQTTKESIPIHGVAVGDALAVHESPVRVLEPGESPDPSLPVGNSDGHCPVSKQAAASTVAVESGGEIFYLCRAGHIAAFARALEEEALAIGPAIHKQAAGAAEVSWTKGPKKVLFMRVNFEDAPDASISEPDAAELMRQANDFFIENSYGATSLSATVTPLLLLPNAASWYGTNGASDALLEDARRAAATAGYDPGHFDLDCVHFRVPGLPNQAYVGKRGAWLQGTDIGTVCHELGHNFGLWHANAWVTTDGSVIGAGRNLEYGDVFDTMGSGEPALYPFGASARVRLGWLPDTAVQTIAADGIYRMYPFDTGTRIDGLSYALRIPLDSERDYWIETRRQLTAQAGSEPSVLVYWGPWSRSNGGSELLDMTPGSEGGRHDAQLVLGRSFFDLTLGLKITPLRLGGTTTESIDVMITHDRTATSPPFISSIAHQVLSSGSRSEPISFTVADVETPATGLTLTASTSNPGLLTDSNIVFGGDGFDRTVTLDPTPGQFGTAAITISVTDTDGNSANASFSLSVAMPPRLTGSKDTAGEFTLILTGGAEGSYVIEATSDLATWEAIGTITTTTGTGQITDTSARYFPRRFYRVAPR